MVSPSPATVPCMPLVVITGVPSVSDACIAWACACIRLRCRAGSTISSTKARAMTMSGKYWSTIDVPLYRAGGHAVGASRNGSVGYVGCGTQR